jgi:hypothetical protein
MRGNQMWMKGMEKHKKEKTTKQAKKS